MARGKDPDVELRQDQRIQMMFRKLTLEQAKALLERLRREFPELFVAEPRKVVW